ncbi:MAG: hypothetical protein B6I25_04805 [Planctomycetales bacterium 4572_13]|nr:MAG: hypothetical protein B6I25_04805 [Planctomycetales bacterium 4572_13]
MFFAIIASGDEKIGFLPVKSPQSGGMKMTKYVHCTVVETRVYGWVRSENAKASEAEPNPRREHLRNTYQMRPTCYFHSPAMMDFRA